MRTLPNSLIHVLVLVMSGGLTRDPERQVEAFFTTSNTSDPSCFLPDLPEDRNFNTLDFVNDQLILCGGDGKKGPGQVSNGRRHKQRTKLGLQCRTALRSYPLTLDPLSLPLVPYPLVLFLSRSLGGGSSCCQAQLQLFSLA